MKISRRLSSETITLVLVVGIGLLAALPLWQAGFLNKRIIGETPYLLMRVQQLYTELRAGVFPVRWMPDGAYGLGYPFFNFYAALPFYLAAVLRFVGFGTILSIKITQTLSFIAGAAGVYLWLRPHLRTRWAALAAAALFTFAPMHLINVYTRGDSLSEFWAMSMYPWLLWAIDRVIEHPKRPGYAAALLTLFYGGLLLSHNISGLIFTPFAGFYAVWMLIATRRRPRWRIVVTLACAFILGAALAAWFLGPALLERPTVRMENLLAGFFDYHSSFLDNALIQPNFAIDYSLYPYRLGLWQALITIAGIGAAFVIIVSGDSSRRAAPGRRSDRWLAVWLLVALLISVVMTLSVSTWLYERVPLLPYLQFPWRWLSIGALMSAAVGAYLVDLYRPALLAGVVISISVVVALVPLNLDFIPLTEAEITQARLNEAEFYSGDIGTTVRADYIPAAVHPRPVSGPAIVGFYPLKALNGEASGSLIERQPDRETWRVTVNSDQADVALATLYWPGWKVRLDNGALLPVSTVDGSGWLQTTVPRGDHTLTVYLSETPDRWLADAISALAALIWCALILRPALVWLRRYRRRVLTGLITVLAFSLMLHLWPAAAPAHGPQASQFETVSYRHAYPDGLPFGGDAWLLDYSYPTEVRAGDPLTIHLHWKPSAQPVQAHADLIPAPVNFWKYDAALASASGTDTLTLAVPTQSAPGVYFVHLAVGSAVYDLTPVHVLAPLVEPITISMENGADFGGMLRLLDVNTQALDRGRLNVYMTWQTAVPITKQYGLSVRFLNPAGIEIAKHEAPLGVYGTVPPAYWPARFTDWFSLPGLDGLPPGEGYRLNITLFDDDKAIGSAELRNVVVKSSPIQSMQGKAPSSCAPQSTSVEQGNSLLITCSWVGPFPVGSEVIWRLLNDSPHTWQATLPLAPGTRLEWWQDSIVYKALSPLAVPLDLVPGNYRIYWNRVDGNTREISVGVAGVVEVKPTTRLMTAPVPPVETPDITFGGLIRLWSYEIQQSAGKLSLRLVWRAQAAIDTDYTYFVHVQRTDAPTPAAQIDTMPHDNQYPTSLWLPDEYIVDQPQVSLDGLAPGDYDVWIGWYDPHSGERLSVPTNRDNRYHLTHIVIP